MSFTTFSATTASGEGEKAASIQTAINGSNEGQLPRLATSAAERIARRKVEGGVTVHGLGINDGGACFEK